MRDLEVVNASADALKVTWSAPADDLPTGILDKYIVSYRDATSTAEKVEVNAREPTTSLMIRDLQPDTAYFIKVCIILQEICGADNFGKSLNTIGFCKITVTANSNLISNFFRDFGRAIIQMLP